MVEVIDKSSYFITEWNIPVAGTEIALPIKGTGVDATIDWGDGTITKVSGNLTVNDFPTHTYAEAKNYNINCIKS